MFFTLFFLGLVTSFVGTNTGGSALITIPVMITLGFPPHVSIACARVTSIGTLVAGIRAFHTQKKVDYKIAFPAAIVSLLGSLTGAVIMTHFSATHLSRAVGVLTLLLLCLPLFLKKNKLHSKPPSLSKKIVG